MTNTICASFRAFIKLGDALSLPYQLQLTIYDFQPLINYAIQP